MKIRNGFVSNSSSASFVLEIRKTKEDVINLLLKELSHYFNRDKFKKRLLKAIKKDEDYRNKCLKEQAENKEAEEKGLKKPHWGLYDCWLPQIEGRLVQYNNLLKNFDGILDAQLVLEALTFYGYHPPYVNELGDFSIGGWTIMWNGDEDMGEVLLAIKTLLDLKYRDKITYRFNFYNED